MESGKREEGEGVRASSSLLIPEPSLACVLPWALVEALSLRALWKCMCVTGFSFTPLWSLCG